jgi:hemerythrin superfamily protein
VARAPSAGSEPGGTSHGREALDPESAEWRAKAAEVHATLQTHIQEEEDAIFPRIRKVRDADRLERAGHELHTMKTRKAGSR